MEFIVIAVIFIVSALIAVRPLFATERLIESNTDKMENLQLKKRVLYREIKELDVDFELGNISEEDYTSARDDLKRNVSQVIDDITSAGK